MGIHLLLMNVAAPGLAFGLHRWQPPRTSARQLAAAAALQIVALWGMHAPALLALTHAPVIYALSYALLFAPALWFWRLVFAPWGAARWRALLALLLTGKLACLLGVLMVFAPRPLYPDFATLMDQQQAGLWMIAACLLTYVLAAVALAVQWLRDLGLAPARLSAGG